MHITAGTGIRTDMPWKLIPCGFSTDTGTPLMNPQPNLELEGRQTDRQKSFFLSFFLHLEFTGKSNVDGC